MTETHVHFRCGDLLLEGLLNELPGSGAVVVAHPHPLYGGDMYNNVVRTAVNACEQLGYTTLRFNFRGVGESQGAYDNGRGERDDLGMAVQYLTELGKDSVDLVGYSFGAWVCALGTGSLKTVQRVALLSPPVDLLDFSEIAPDPRFRLITVGTSDAFASVATVTRFVTRCSPDANLQIIEQADHFCWGHEPKLQAMILAELRSSVT